MYIKQDSYQKRKFVLYLIGIFDSETSTYKYSHSNHALNNSTKYKYKPTSTGGTVQVKGYYRKDGTYVKPHTRRAPSRRK